jgi:hypothetical protein
MARMTMKQQAKARKREELRQSNVVVNRLERAGLVS